MLLAKKKKKKKKKPTSGSSEREEIFYILILLSITLVENRPTGLIPRSTFQSGCVRSVCEIGDTQPYKLPSYCGEGERDVDNMHFFLSFLFFPPRPDYM